MSTVDGPWDYREEEHQLYHMKMKKCLALHPESSKLMLRDCDKSNSYHKWNWGVITPYWAKNSHQPITNQSDVNSYVSFYFNYLSTREVSTVSLSCSDSNSFFYTLAKILTFYMHLIGLLKVDSNNFLLVKYETLGSILYRSELLIWIILPYRNVLPDS